MDPDPGYNGTIRFQLEQEFPDPSTVSIAANFSHMHLYNYLSTYNSTATLILLML